MSNAPQVKEQQLAPRIIEVELVDEVAPMPALGPRVIATERNEAVIPAERPITAAVPAPVPRRDRVVTFGLTGIALLLVGWAVVDAAAWITAAFDRSTTLGVLAAFATTAGLTGAGAVIVRETVSLLRLKNVEEVRRRLTDRELAPVEIRKSVTEVLAVLPRDRETERAIAQFQREIQSHHSPPQQIDLLSRGVLTKLDERAQAHVRTAVLRAFGITAISPTALTDAAFFLACGVRMVRGIAGAYGHRPTAATTVHLLRRLLLEAGKLGAVDLASASLVQHLGGAVTERFASMTAEAVYAAYRMARLGIIVMDLCRPVAFAENEVPSVGSLVSGVLRRRAEGQIPAPA